jgi:TonB family protein
LGTSRIIRRIWPCFLALAATAVVAFGAIPPAKVKQATLAESERQLWTIPARLAQFGAVPHVSSRPSCEDVHPPEALTTPDPLLVQSFAGRKVKVSFIVGSDGRVHSPLILESAGAASDRNVLRTVKTWRYRPATCNGVPTEAEGKIEFSRR